MENKIKSSQLDWEAAKVKGFFGKELINFKNGGLKLVKIEPLASYPVHVHPTKTEYAYVLIGSPNFEIEDQQFSSEPGDFFIFPVAKKHAILNKTDLECVLLIGNIEN
jgi:quercetin dioxygenase-like cupin family protein